MGDLSMEPHDLRKTGKPYSLLNQMLFDSREWRLRNRKAMGREIGGSIKKEEKAEIIVFLEMA